MKELQPDTNFSAAVRDEREIDADETVSFAPDSQSIALEQDITVETTDTECDDTDCDVDIDDLETSAAVDNDLVGQDPIDTEVADTEYGDSDWTEGEGPVLVYDVPRPALTIDEAAAILGKSIRAVERGITGKWGNRLPEGWKARKMKIDGQDEWRIIPPPNFRVRHSKVRTPKAEDKCTESKGINEGNGTDMTSKATERPATAPAPTPRSTARNEESPGLLDNDKLFGFSFNNLLHSAGQRAKTELAKAAEYAKETTMEYPTIVIDRSDDVELLLRELAETRKELCEERRMHLEDLRIMADMQGSMRLLELKSSQTSTLKEELQDVTRTLKEHRRQYQEFLALPWWKRLFRKSP